MLKNPKLLELIFAKIDAETSRANSAEKFAQNLMASRDEWKNIADKEKLRGDSLDQALQAFKQESVELRMSRDFLRQSIDDYAKETKELRSEANKLRSRQKYVFGTGMVVGAGAVFLGTRR